MNVVLHWSDYPNFSAWEFKCKCGCGRVEMTVEFMDALQAARTELGFLFRISSGYRCPEYNNRISSTGKNGPHTTGQAADILIIGGSALALIRYPAWFGVGDKQHGSHKDRFVHVDTLTNDETAGPRPWKWSYR